MTSETEAREIAHIATGCCLTAAFQESGEHVLTCNSVTTAILAYGDKRAGDERARCNAIIREAWDAELADRLVPVRSLPERTTP